MAQKVHGKIGLQIQDRLAALNPTHLEVWDESEDHHRGGNESHFRVLFVSPSLQGLSRVERSRKVQDLLQDLQTQIHALSLRLLTPEEYEKFTQDSLKSPVCSSK